MSEKQENPFAKLDGLFPEAGKNRSPRNRETPLSRPARPGGKKHERHGSEALQEDTEDAALFLDVVGVMRPLEPGEETGHSMAEALERSFGPRKEGGFAMAGKKGKKAKPGPGAKVPEPVAASTGAATMASVQGTPGPGSLEEELFTKAMQGVRPVGARGREVTPDTAGAAGKGVLPDPAKALRDLLEGRVEFAVSHSDEYLEGHVVGVDPKILDQLRSGQFSPEAHLDLHGQNARQAFESLTWFMKSAYQRNLRTVLVVTGRGKNSPDGIGILRPSLQQWLCREPFKRVVLAFCSAKPSDGGPGAVYVLLRKYKKGRGKIVWERTLSDDDFPY